MKKICLNIILMMIFCMFFIGCGIQKPSKIKNNDFKSEKYSFYIEANENRYQEYQKANPEVSWKNVILRVNIGLDQPYYVNSEPSIYLNTSKLLVNKYFYLLEDYVPNNLVELDINYSKGGISLVDVAAENFKRMVDAAREDKINIRAISAYRSYQYQVTLYNNYVKRDGKDEADTYSARPGYSEHQTGLCVDVDNGINNFTDFEKTTSFEWMAENAHKFGFILRYPEGMEEITGYSYESWHYRYVGKKIATYIKEKNITFDEYYMEFLNG